MSGGCWGPAGRQAVRAGKHESKAVFRRAGCVGDGRLHGEPRRHASGKRTASSSCRPGNCSPDAAEGLLRIASSSPGSAAAPSPPSTRRSTPLFKNDPRLVAKIKKAAAAYGIDPIHIIGAIVGEHTYNIDTYRHAPDLLRQGAAIRRQHLADLLLPRPDGAAALRACRNSPSARRSRTTTSCGTAAQTVWNASVLGQDGRRQALPDDRLHRVFFQPIFGGQTFGLGQLEPGGGADGHRRGPRQERPAAPRASTTRRRSTSRS